MKSTALATPDYRAFVGELKTRVAAARLSASRAVNRDLILLYWDIGGAIVEKQRLQGWGEAVVETVAKDLRDAFPGMRGFSANNIWLMRQFYSEYSEPAFLEQFVQEMENSRRVILRQPVAEIDKPDPIFLEQVVPELAKARGPILELPVPESALPGSAAILAHPARESISPLRHGSRPRLEQLVQEILCAVPWGHNLEIVKKEKRPAARLYYLRATARFGWSRKVLLNQIKAGAYERSRQEGKLHNFPAALPEHLAEQAEEALKSSYNLEFLGLGRAVKERELEDQLVGRLRDFILELGYGFCFAGRQHRLALGTKEYFVDLLFYHRFLKALVAIDLKIGAFVPEFSGKMDFYLNLLNDKERAPDDRPSIGIILCAEKDNLEVEYALRTKANPIGVAAYRLQPNLPAAYKGKLPTARQLTAAIRPILPDAAGS